MTAFFDFVEFANPTFLPALDWIQIDNHIPCKERSLSFPPRRASPLRWNSWGISNWPAFPEYGTTVRMRVSPFSSLWIEARILGGLFFPASIIQDDLVDNLAAVDASPAKKIFVRTVKFFKGHRPMASRTFHLSLLKIIETCIPSYKRLEKKE